MIGQAGRLLPVPSSRTFRFELGETSDDEKGICGGSVEFLIETFDESALPLFRDLVEAADSDEPAVLVSIISPDTLPHKMLVRDAPAGSEFTSEIVTAIKEVNAGRRRAARVSIDAADAFLEGLSRPPTVILFGAGHVACHIARYASAVHFSVTVFDDRDEYACKERFPTADDLIVADLGSVLDRIRIDEHTYVVIVTRGHRYDETVLEQVVGTGAKYVGMIGSRRKTQTILDRLRQKGFSQEKLGSVCSPIGLAIGAVTPEEIALSIVCELVKIRRLGRTARVDHMAITSEGGRA